MSLENVKDYLKKFNLDNEVIILDDSSATVELAAKALNTDPARIAKSLSFLVNDKPILVLTAGDVKIDNKKFKNYFNQKAKFIPIDQVEEYIGHPVGGVCPFGIKENVKVYLDNSLRKYDYVYPAAGEVNSCIKLTIDQLEKTSNVNQWIDVSKN